MENLDKVELNPCPICNNKTEHRFDIYRYEVWACGCWRHQKPIYANSPNHKNAIENWNSGIKIVGLDQDFSLKDLI